MRSDLITRVRQLAVNQRGNHPWKDLDDFDLLKSAQLYLRDYQTGKEGFTLAAVLLLGKDDVLLSVLPHFRTDAILRIQNLDRYDDRDDIRTNLIESYDRIMAFTQKHLPDPFYLENDKRISVRDKIFREVASNILIHREYMNAFPAKLIIQPTRVYTENSNKPHGNGIIDPNNFSPFPKNPVIARFFKEIGLADELGSGTRNLMKYVRIYSDNEPQLIEEDIFKMIIPLTPHATAQDIAQDIAQDTAQDTAQDERTVKIIEFCKTERTASEIMNFLELTHREYFRSKILNPLLEQGLLHPTIPDKLTSPKQKYFSSLQ
ncbi:MAG: hypothetical protein Q7J10_04570 [Methanosarcinaceae archaeon]|nr:hypothetical protein [Methanosarcinaceae archaeon]